MSGQFTKQEIEAKCQDNIWLKHNGVDFEDDWLMESDYDYGVYDCKTLDEFIQKMRQGNWSIRSCFTYKNLAFVNQVNGSDEWWAIFKHPDGRLEDFESISFGAMIRAGDDMEAYMSRLLEGPDAYWERGA